MRITCFAQGHNKVPRRGCGHIKETPITSHIPNRDAQFGLENKLACICLFQYVTGLILFVYDLDAKIMMERILTDTKVLITSKTIYLVYATV